MSKVAVTIVGFALLLGACGRGPHGPERIGHEETLLEVSATAKGDSKPDEARFTAGVSSVGASAAAATQANDAKMAAVIAAVRRAGVAAADIQTQALSVARQDYGANKGKFEASNSVTVRVRAVDTAGAVIGAATGAGANLVSGPDLRTADPEAASRALAGKAFRAARARADAYADAAGLHVSRVLTIRDGGNPPGETMTAAFDVAAPPGIAPAPVAAPVMAGTNTTEVTVGVAFALAPK